MPVGLQEDPVGLAAGGWRRHVSIQRRSPDAFLGGDPCRGERAVKAALTLPLQPGSQWAAVVPLPISTVRGLPLPLLLQPRFVLYNIR